MVKKWSLKSILIIAGAAVLCVCLTTPIQARTKGPGVTGLTPRVQNLEEGLTGEVSVVFKKDITDTPAATNSSGINLSSLEVSPAQVNPGYQVTVNVMATNTGSQTASCDINLKINNRTVSTKKVTDLAAGDSQKVTFTTVQNRLGDYEVYIGELKGTFKVVELAESKAEPINWWIMGILIVCCLTLLWIIGRNLLNQRKKPQ